MSVSPNPEFEIEKLGREHDLTQFDCGNTTLNSWLVKYAWANQQADSAKTYVAVAGERVDGLTDRRVFKRFNASCMSRPCMGFPTVACAYHGPVRRERGSAMRAA